MAFFIFDSELMVEKELAGRHHRLKQDLLTSFAGISSGVNHFIFEVMEKTVQYSLPAGLFQQSRKLYFWTVQLSSHKNPEEFSKVLTIGDLRFLFTIWMVTLVMSIILFIGEILRSYCEKAVEGVFALVLVKIFSTNYFKH